MNGVRHLNGSTRTSLGVHDVDEARSRIVLGNGFGELAFYDFSDSFVADSAGCFRDDLEASAYSSEKLLPTKVIERKHVAPFPYNGDTHVQDPTDVQELFKYGVSIMSSLTVSNVFV
ncbi:hypothetical protein QCA50_012312 [Cerrena zonata]|uniref:Uncharacterized protein n=1 Tax=Cerrena zonata TaxID=2478898 RepID=A0AAW0F7D1_9APHY